METNDNNSKKNCCGKKRLSRREFIGRAAVVAGAAGATGILSSPQIANAFQAPPWSTPSVACGGGATGVSVNITFTAGATGAPPGFVIEWMSAAAYAANGGWCAPGTCCSATFPGGVGPNQSVTVQIGNFAAGANTNCPGELDCGTQYIFRAYVLPGDRNSRSDYSANALCSTVACGPGGGCTFTVGYWKTHGPIPTGNNSNEWPVTSLTLGTVTYTDLQLLQILGTPVKGNGLISLAHQLIAAKLNIANGASGASIAGAIASADALIGGLVIPPIGTGYLAPKTTGALNTTLTNFNEGATGPGHCGSDTTGGGGDSGPI